ncbi:MAG: NAD(P)H-binding protein [Vicinamibacterales bacterium]
MSTRIVITGANSAVGQAILRRAARHPDLVLVAAVRSERAMKDLPPLPPDQRARIGYDDPASLQAAFAGADAVVHLAGTLIEKPGSTYESANVQTTDAVVAAARASGVGKLVLVSAIGADPRSPNRYFRTKGQAEDLVRRSGLAHTILRAPLLLGPGTEGTAAVERHLSKPTATLPGGGANWQQPLHVDDLARAALVASGRAVAADATLDVVGPEPVREREIIERTAAVTGRAVAIKSIPVGLLRVVLRVQGLFRKGGFSADVLDVITADTKMDPSPAMQALGFPLTGLDTMIGHGHQPAHRG